MKYLYYLIGKVIKGVSVQRKMMMGQVRRVIPIVHLLQIQVVHLSLVLRQVGEVQKRAQKITEMCEDQEGRKRKRVALTVAGDVVIAMTVSTRKRGSLIVAKTGIGEVTRTGKGKIERTGKGVGVVGVEAEVGQTLVGVGTGMTGESPRMRDGTTVDMNQMVGVERVMTVKGEIVVIITNHAHIDTGGKVAHQLGERTKSMAKARGQDTTHLALVLHRCLSSRSSITEAREEGTPVPGQVR